jgi:hypothetical protein
MYLSVPNIIISTKFVIVESHQHFCCYKRTKKRGEERGDVIDMGDVVNGLAETFQGCIGRPPSPPFSQAESWQQRARREKS